jgi:hypothetical protein
VFVGPDAKLMDRSGKQVGKYYGPPATWEGMDGVKLTATQVAVAPAAAGNIPLQLVKANAASGNGMVSGTTYIQRVATRGGVAPAMPCAAGNTGASRSCSTRPTTSSGAPRKKPGTRRKTDTPSDTANK